VPSSIDGIEKYLGSGMIRGIGPVCAKKMVKPFGERAQGNRLKKCVTNGWRAESVVIL